MRVKPITVDDKYTIFNDNGILTVHRYGKEWGDFVGDKFTLSLVQKIETLIEVNEQLSKANSNLQDKLSEHPRFVSLSIDKANLNEKLKRAQKLAERSIMTISNQNTVSQVERKLINDLVSLVSELDSGGE